MEARPICSCMPSWDAAEKNDNVELHVICSRRLWVATVVCGVLECRLLCQETGPDGSEAEPTCPHFYHV